MAALTLTSLLTGNAQTGTLMAMSASDTIAYNRAPAQRLIMINPTNSDVTVSATGDSEAAFTVDGYGELDPTTPLSLVVPAASGGNDGFLALKLNDRDRFFVAQNAQTSTITLTNGTGLFVLVLNG